MNEKLHDNLNKLPPAIKKMLNQDKILGRLPEFGVNHESKIASDVFDAGADLSKAIKTMAKRYSIERVGVVIIEGEEEGDVVILGSGDDLTMKVALRKAYTLLPGWTKFSDYPYTDTINNIISSQNFTLYIAEKTYKIRHDRQRNRNFEDKYQETWSGNKSIWMSRASRSGSKERSNLRASKLQNAEVLSFRLDSFEALIKVVEAVRRKDVKAIEVDGIYIGPYYFDRIGFADNFNLKETPNFIKDLMETGSTKIGYIRGFDQYVDSPAVADALENGNNKLTYGNQYDIIASISNSGHLRFSLKGR